MAYKNEKLLEYVRRNEYKRRLDEHEVWGHVGGKLYTLIKILFTIGFALAQLVNISYLAVWINRYVSEYANLANPGSTLNSIIIVGSMAALLIAAYVLLAKRRPIGYAVCTLIPSIVLPIHFYGEMSDIIAASGLRNYILKHALWYAVMAVTMLIMLIIQLRENTHEKKMYEKLEAKLYDRAAASGGDSVFSEGDWEELLSRFDGTEQEFISRAEKKRRRNKGANDSPPGGSDI